MTIELTVEELAKLRVCSSCVGERFLSVEIRSRGDERVCSYCKDQERTFSIDELADEISVAFRDHYFLTNSDPDIIEYHAWMDDEISYDWERGGYPVTDVIADAAGVTNEVAEDIRLVLEKRGVDDWPSSVGY